MLTLAIGLTFALTPGVCTDYTCPGSPQCGQQLGSPAENGEDAHLGYQINPGTGNVYLQHTDIAVRPAAGPSLVFSRHYNSQANSSGGLGNNWTHTYSWSVSTASGAQITTDTGRAIQFVANGSAWVAQPGEFGTLTGSAAAGFTYTTKYGVAYLFDNTVSNLGRLLSINLPDNTPISVTYTGAGSTTLSRVSSGAASLSFSYTGSQITGIIDNGTSTIWKYNYSAGNLVSVVFPNTDGTNFGQTDYSYSNITLGGRTFTAGTSSGQLTGVQVHVSGSSGINNVYALLFSYTNPVGGGSRVTAAASGFDGTNLLRYATLAYNLCVGSASTTTVTYATDDSAKFISSIAPTADAGYDFQRLSAIVSDGGSGEPSEVVSEALTWNNTLTVAAFANGNGNITNFSSYDTKGNPTTVVEGYSSPVARTTIYTYHAVLSRPLTMTRLSVDGTHNHVTTWDYDSDHNTVYNQSPTNYLYQVVESGMTNVGLDGGLNSLQTYTAQIFRDSSNYFRVTQVTGARAGESYFLTYYPSTGAYPNYLEAVTSATVGSNTLVSTYNGYDGDGRLLKVTDPNGMATSYIYDPLGKIMKTTVSGGSASQSTTYDYDLAEDLLSEVSTEGNALNFVYDGALRRSEIYAQASPDAGGAVPWSIYLNFDTWNHAQTIRRFSDAGVSSAVGCSSSGTEQFCRNLAHDSYRRLSVESTLDSTNNACTGTNCEVLYTYDGNGNVASRSEAGLNVTTYDRDALDRVNKLLLPGGAYSMVTYDVNDRLVTRYDPKASQNGGSGGSGRLTKYRADDFGRYIGIVSPDIGTWVTDYDPNGNVAASADGTGAILQYSFDFLNRLTGIQGAAGDSVAFEYDQTSTVSGYTRANTSGRLSGVYATDPLGNVVNTFYSYDMEGRAVTEIDQRGDAGAPTAAATQYSYGGDGELLSVTYPDGKSFTYRYPTSSGFAPVPLASEIDVNFGGINTLLVTNAAYFPDGMIESLSYGNGSIRQLQRNKRGELTSLTSGPSSSPDLAQALGYDPHGLGEITAVNFFPGKSNSWSWTLGYDSRRELTSYSTNVRPTTDSYSWSYDEVGNRTSETYNTATTYYGFDASNNTNHLSALTGATSRTWTYDADGDVVQDHWTGSSSVWNQYLYNSRHHLKELDYYSSSTLQYALETYVNDGLERRWQKTNHNGTWSQYYYDLSGRVLQEYQNNNVTVNSCPAYDVIDHVYLASGAREVARVVRQFRSSGGVGCPSSSYSLVDVDVRYVHEDYRATVFAVEGKSHGGLVWEGETSPFGIIVHEGLPGVDGKIGTTDDQPALSSETMGLGEASRDDEFSNLEVGGAVFTPSVARQIQPQRTLASILGLSPYEESLGTGRFSAPGAGVLWGPSSTRIDVARLAGSGLINRQGSIPLGPRTGRGPFTNLANGLLIRAGEDTDSDSSSDSDSSTSSDSSSDSDSSSSSSSDSSSDSDSSSSSDSSSDSDSSAESAAATDDNSSSSSSSSSSADQSSSSSAQSDAASDAATFGDSAAAAAGASDICASTVLQTESYVQAYYAVQVINWVQAIAAVQEVIAVAAVIAVVVAAVFPEPASTSVLSAAPPGLDPLQRDTIVSEIAAGLAIPAMPAMSAMPSL